MLRLRNGEPIKHARPWSVLVRNCEQNNSINVNFSCARATKPAKPKDA